MAAPKPSMRWMGSRNFTPGVYDKTEIVLHWAVGRMAMMDGMAAYANDRSSTPHFMVDGEHSDKIHQYVDVRGRAWHAGNANSKSVGIETAGGWEVTGPGLHQRFKPSAETHEQTAQLCAWLADELRLGDLAVGRNLKPHNAYSNTMCPGTLDLAWIATRANEIRKGDARPAPSGPDVKRFIAAGII